MLDCLILGDDIAKGISNLRRDCARQVETRATSQTFVQKNLSISKAGTIIISLGAYDTKTTSTRINLIALRNSIVADLIFWVLPNNNNEIRNIIANIAYRYGDQVLDLRKEKIGMDGIRPTPKGYTSLVKKTKIYHAIPV